MKELSTETRVLLAFVLSISVMAVWGTFFSPKPPPQPPEAPPVATQPAEKGAGQAAGAPSSEPAKVAPAPAAPAAPPKGAAEEKTLVIENDLYRVELSNRGGTVRSWQLKKYVDDAKPPRVLDLVHPEAARERGEWPLSLVVPDANDAGLEKAINQDALYRMTPEAGTHAPGEVRLEWSDGRVEVTKRLVFAHNYLVDIETSLKVEGQPVAHGIAWRSGFGDETVFNAPELVTVFYRTSGKLESKEHKKLGIPDHQGNPLREIGTMDYAGVQDSYFVAAFLPRASQGGMALWHWKHEREVLHEKEKVKVPVAEMAAGSTVAGPVGLRLFVGPKDYEVLGKLDPPMTDLIQFGEWLGVVAKPLFFFLKWIHTYVPNFGWAIVLMTVAINMAMFPLKVKSWRSMQKMQKVAPEVKTIQEKYKKYSLRDPRKQQMNQEIMALYKREGISPMGSCWPMMLQMPIWFALYRMLNVTIELRHAPWLWIRDLSAKDPYYILPVTMAVTMYWMQKMTPVTSTDPAQQRMMQLMPIMFGGIFIISPISSGLVLYILASNVVGMAQQWFLNRTSPLPVKGKEKNGKKK